MTNRRGEQLLLPDVPVAVDESLPPGLSQDPTDEHIVVKVYSKPHCTCEMCIVRRKAFDMATKMSHARGTLREGGTETETANGGDSPVYITETLDPRSDEEMTQWASETGFQREAKPKARSASRAKRARKEAE